MQTHKNVVFPLLQSDRERSLAGGQRLWAWPTELCYKTYTAEDNRQAEGREEEEGGLWDQFVEAK